MPDGKWKKLQNVALSETIELLKTSECQMKKNYKKFCSSCLSSQDWLNGYYCHKQPN